LAETAQLDGVSAERGRARLRTPSRQRSIFAGERHQARQDHSLERLTLELSLLREWKDSVLKQACLGAGCAIDP
jgi:hypothetical protein